MIAVHSFYVPFTHAGGLLCINVSKEILLKAQNSHGCYLKELEKKKLLERKSEKLEKKRKRAAEEM